MAKRAHCWFGRHAWVKRESSDGDVYGECTHCGKRDWGRFTKGDGGIGVPGSKTMGAGGSFGVSGGI
jgi:hypothetical protein